ncbi:KRR1 interacting protein 1 [Carpediemonas membranifera]|uniref:KRR1 interacting protein 1 n=1 Tax=Carpediemonas membranifera TaxID=201153 RepID=A0A8J6ASF8_9EUKA|nr:KRR1 interacting protein 1 [Carpediemonas membranifera]|eukprot:KAG9390330.1 KRR1 interacting protein 1 [Carpediemonas membranifera]
MAKKRATTRQEDSSSGYSSSSDSDIEHVMTEEVQEQFKRTLEAIKRKDPAIYDGKLAGGKASILQNKKPASSDKKISFADWQMQSFHHAAQEKGHFDSDDDDLDEDLRGLPNAVQEQRLAEQLMGLDSDDDEGDGMFMTREPEGRTRASADEEEAAAQFIKDVVTTDSVKVEVPATARSEGVNEDASDVQTTIVEGSRLSKKELKKISMFRHEEAGADRLVTRMPEETLRKKKEKRKEKRLRQEARKEEKRKQQLVELRKLRKEKRAELVARLKELVKEGDVDPATLTTHPLLRELGDIGLDDLDEIMGEVYDDYYYGDDGVMEKPVFSDDDEMMMNDGDEEMEEESNADADADADADAEDAARAARKERAQVREYSKVQLDTMLAELNSIEHEDVVGGIPCRFHYVQVAPESYGMSAEEILDSDERTLNSKVPLAMLAPYAAGKNDRELKAHAKKTLVDRRVREKAAKRREKIKDGKVMVKAKAKRLGDGRKVSAARMDAYGLTSQRKGKK